MQTKMLRVCVRMRMNGPRDLSPSMQRRPYIKLDGKTQV